MIYRAAALLLSVIALACGDQGTQAGTAPARFLYVWAGDKDEKHSDFLAVVDVREKSRSYGQVIATEPVGMSGTLPHHLEYQLPPRGQLLFANGHHHEQIFLFNSDSADRPKLAGRLPAAAPLRYPHDFARLSNGNVLVGYLRSEGASPLPGDTTRPGNHGGIAEFDGQGRLLRTASAAVAGDTIPIRPYAFAVLTDLDLLLTTSAPMMEDASADVIQLWRLSDFQLLRTLPVPHARAANGSEIPDAHRYPFEPRIMRDGSVLLNAFGCGFYQVTGLETATPIIHHVYTIDVPQAQLGSCGVPVMFGRYWLMSVGQAHLLVTLDVSDPAHPAEVARLAADTLFRPHWLARDPGSNRIIVGAENGGENRMLMARIDTATGRLRWDKSFQARNRGAGLSFERDDWPHGRTGPAFGHAALFR